MLDYDMFDRRTDKLVELLQNSTRLGDGLGSTVRVVKGLRSLGADELAVYVFRQGVDGYGYWMGTQGTDIEASWGLTCVVRRAGDPEALETSLARLVANVVGCIGANARCAGYWDSAEPQRHQAVNVRDANNQTWEIEIVPVRLKWSEV